MGVETLNFCFRKAKASSSKKGGETHHFLWKVPFDDHIFQIKKKPKWWQIRSTSVTHPRPSRKVLEKCSLKQICKKCRLGVFWSPAVATVLSLGTTEGSGTILWHRFLCGCVWFVHICTWRWQWGLAGAAPWCCGEWIFARGGYSDWGWNCLGVYLPCKRGKIYHMDLVTLSPPSPAPQGAPRSLFTGNRKGDWSALFPKIHPRTLTLQSCLLWHEQLIMAIFVWVLKPLLLLHDDGVCYCSISQTNQTCWGETQWEQRPDPRDPLLGTAVVFGVVFS